MSAYRGYTGQEFMEDIKEVINMYTYLKLDKTLDEKEDKPKKTIKM